MLFNSREEMVKEFGLAATKRIEKEIESGITYMPEWDAKDFNEIHLVDINNAHCTGNDQFLNEMDAFLVLCIQFHLKILRNNKILHKIISDIKDGKITASDLRDSDKDVKNVKIQKLKIK